MRGVRELMPRAAVFLALVLVAAGCEASGTTSPTPEVTPESTTAITPNPTPDTNGALPLPGPGEGVPAGRYVLTQATGSGWIRATLDLPTARWDSWGRGVLTGTWEAWVPGAANPGVTLGFVLLRNVYADPCRNHHRTGFLDAAVVDTADSLATALSEMPGYVASAPADVTVAGFPAKYVRMTIDPAIDFAECDDGYFSTGWRALPDEFSVNAYHPSQIEEYWVVDLNGTPLTIMATTFAGTTEEDADELGQVFNSIQLE